MMRPSFSLVRGEMAPTRIKICGVTRQEDALAAVSAGADAIGLVFVAASPRSVTPEQACGIVSVIPPFVTVVALFADEPAASVRRILDAVPIDLLQFHGGETPDFCRQFNRPWIKALRVRPGLDLAAQCQRYSGARGVLLDAWHEGKAGGTGKTFDWALARCELPVPIVLAGGLHKENVGEAVMTLRPAAVDVSSGVESAPGIKNASELRRFVAAVRAVDETLQDLHNDK